MKLVSKVMLYTFSKVAKRYKNAFEKDLEYADRRNNQLLMEIIRKNIGTEYGKKYGFQSIDSPQKFKDSVPLTVYDDYKCQIERMAEGKDNILTSEKVEFLYRKNQLINIYSEKTSEQAIHQAVVETFKDLRIELVDYTVMADINVSPGRYVFFVEVNNADSLDKLEVQKILESKLCMANPRYDHYRKVMKINHSSLELLKPQTFNSFKILLLSKGASRNQLKIPRVVSKDYLVEFLKSNTYEKSEELCKL